MELCTHAHTFPDKMELGLEFGVGACLFQVCQELGMELRMLITFSVLISDIRWQGSGIRYNEWNNVQSETHTSILCLVSSG